MNKSDFDVVMNILVPKVPKSVIRHKPDTQRSAIMGLVKARATVNMNMDYMSQNNGRQNAALYKDLFKWFAGDKDLVNYWTAWINNLPTKVSTPPLQPGDIVYYSVVVSAHVDKITWRSVGTQRAMVRPIVDFFCQVGDTESEIDAIDQYGAMVNPGVIGDYIEMSSSFGTTEGWIFMHPTDSAIIKNLVEPCKYRDELMNWVLNWGFLKTVMIERETVETSYRRTGFTFLLSELPPQKGEDCLNDARCRFGIPCLPSSISELFEKNMSEQGRVYLSVSICQTGFAGFSLMFSDPTNDVVTSILEEMPMVSLLEMKTHETMINDTSMCVEYIEYRFTPMGFGYNVFREGSDIRVHYSLGTDALV